MISTYLVFNSDGSLEAAYRAAIENVYATPLQHISECPWVDITDMSKLHYLDKDLVVHTIDRVEGMKFNYDTLSWFDSTSLDEAKANKWAAIKAQRDALEFGGFNWNGYIFDSDPLSQGRLIGAAMLGTGIVWTLKDNSTVELTGTELTEVSLGLQQYVASLHERGRIARASIESATTIDEVNSIIL